ncbi:hypothetical protein SCHPADRAFT_766928 [Schizopora paradoxa]|uniref:Uncharacterized protein n=1 Tax=Schizopora paradoxa TaxID=27342 RepID=A0A0H2QWT3_9AGAM|nr:hypothetical protein SCHPADRAFT_766928 [Schizopora paradoxa]
MRRRHVSNVRAHDAVRRRFDATYRTLASVAAALYSMLSCRPFPTPPSHHLVAAAALQRAVDADATYRTQARVSRRPRCRYAVHSSLLTAASVDATYRTPASWMTSWMRSPAAVSQPSLRDGGIHRKLSAS